MPPKSRFVEIRWFGVSACRDVTWQRKLRSKLLRDLVGRPAGEGGLIYYWRRGHYRRAETNGERRIPAAPGARFWSVQTQREYSENQ